MGIIQKQSIKSSIFILIGFALGAINILLLAPKVLSPEVLGLTRIFTDLGMTLATFCTLGSMPIIYKFFPFYKSYLPAKRNDMPFVTLMVCILGFILTCSAGYLLKDIIARKYSVKSILFVQYQYMVYPYCLFLLLYLWLECFSWSLKKSVISNTLKELLPRILFTLSLALFAFKLLNLDSFLWIFAASFLPSAIVLFLVLRRTGEFHFNSTISPVTRRLKGRMLNFGLFIYGAQFLHLLSRASDTLIIASKADNGLTDAAVFTIAQYIATLLEVPQRSMMSITVPVLVESWRNKDMQNIQHIYSRSVSNLLAIGLGMFGILWLNGGNMAAFLGKDYSGMAPVILFLGIAKLIDLGTGANGQIIGTSNYWRVDFTTNVVYTLLTIPMNYFLISKFGIMGAAYSTLATQIIYNLMRFIFLWYKFNLQPYNLKHLLALLISALAIVVAWLIPQQSSFITDGIIRTAAFIIVFAPLIFVCKISEELNQMASKYYKKATGAIFK